MPALTLALLPLFVVPRPVSVLYALGEGSTSVSFYVFTMSEPQAHTHATSTRPLMPPDQEQVVNIIPFKGFSNTGCTLRMQD